MGNFITSTQIYNPKLLDRKQFINFFREEMKKNGYVTTSSDESEISYILRFADDCKWVTITSDAYEKGNQLSQSDAGRIAKMLRTVCINTTVIDSDCAILEMYGADKQKVDTLIIGRADDYFSEDIHLPSESAWKPILVDKSIWDKFCAIIKDSEGYTFVEEGLAKLAPFIGMGSENILFYAEDSDENEQTVFLNFKKAEAKKEKKLTLNTLFTQIYGEVLEPLGFKKPKLHQLYYVRVINDEIIHIIGINDMKSHLVAFGGIATVYRKELCLDHSFRQNERWLRTLIDFYAKWHISNKPFNQEIQSGFHYHEYIESKPLSKAVQNALNESMTWILPVLDNVKTLKDVADYDECVFKNHISVISLPLQESLAAPYSDASIRFLLNDPLADLEQRYTSSLKLIDEEDIRCNRTQEEILRNRKEYEQRYNESCERIHMFLEDKEMHDQTLEELARRKKHNIEMLKKYNVY
jgi:hypothetical protein